MPFSEAVRNQLWIRAGGGCECRRTVCGHLGRCNRVLGAGAWHANHVVAELVGGPSTFANGEALCVPCHQNTRSYGRS